MTDGQHRPRKASQETENAVRCPHCRSAWDADTLYKTGDVLRCPSCDGVMRP